MNCARQSLTKIGLVVVQRRAHHIGAEGAFGMAIEKPAHNARHV